MSDTAEGQGQMRPRAGRQSLTRLSGRVVTARHTALVGGGGHGAPSCPDSSLVGGVKESRQDFGGNQR